MDTERPSTGEGARAVTSHRTSPSLSLSSSSHQRSMSERKAKRFSLTFPIQTSPLSPVLPYTPSLTDTPAVAPLSAPADPADSAFLTALAAHERRVLELREELAKAEQELQRLKQTWAAHEAHKKRHDARKVHKMQLLADPQPMTQNDHAQRRRALLSGTKTSNRTVFSGSRHARTLSLLTPEMNSQFRSHPTPDPDPELDPVRPPIPPRVFTDPDLTTEVDRTADDLIDLGLPREVLLKTGKQMATDFRDGLWTFIEDLRQATVGDEAINATTSRTQIKSPRPQPSKGGLRPPPRPQPLKRSATTGSRRTTSRSPVNSAAEDLAYLDIGNSFWKENGLDEPKEAPPPVLRKPSKKPAPHSSDLNCNSSTSSDAWDTWDSPEKSDRSNSASSASEARTSPSPDGTSPRTSVSSVRDSKRDSLPWPVLTKLAPSNLRRTASHLMNEWEKSLSPTLSERDRQTDYMGRAGSPVGSVKETKND